MPIAPIFTSPCDLAIRMPTMIAAFLDIEQSLKRRFREDSISDIFVASLLSLPGNGIVVLTPNEAKTGGDIDLVIVDPATGDAVQFRIQAKRLTPHDGNWGIGSYRELAHPNNSGSQSKTLVSTLGREAITTFPLYAFYNPERTCTGSGGSVSGLELASGWDVRELIKMMVRVKPKRLPFKRIGVLQSLFFPLATILCPPSSSPARRLIPLPAEARSAVDRVIEERGNASGLARQIRVETRSPRFLRDSQESVDRAEPDRLPAVVRMAIERREERLIPARVKRPKIILISENDD